MFLLLEVVNLLSKYQAQITSELEDCTWLSLVLLSSKADIS